MHCTNGCGRRTTEEGDACERCITERIDIAMAREEELHRETIERGQRWLEREEKENG